MRKFIVIFIFYFSPQVLSDTCLDNLNLKSEKWQATKAKLASLKAITDDFPKPKKTEKPVAVASTFGAVADNWDLPLNLLSGRFFFYVFVVDMSARILTGSLTCDDSNFSKYLDLYDSCEKPSPIFTMERGFSPKTIEFLQLPEEAQARELLTHTEYCEAISNAYDEFYPPSYSLQCGRGELTLVDSKDKSSVRLRWRDDGEFTSLEHTHLFDPMDAIKINFLAKDPKYINYVNPSELNSGNRNRRADFDTMGAGEVRFTNRYALRKPLLERLKKVQVRSTDMFNMKSCCDKTPGYEARCNVVLPKQAQNAPPKKKAK